MKSPHLFLLAAALAASAPALAQTPPAGGKIGFVQTERIFRESAPAVRALKQLDNEFQKRRRELGDLEDQLKRMQLEFDRNAMTLSETQRRAKEVEFDALRREFQRKDREFREDANLRRNQEMKQVIEQANRAIQQIAEQEKFDIIFQEMPAYVNPRIDITEKVIKALEGKPSPK